MSRPRLLLTALAAALAALVITRALSSGGAAAPTPPPRALGDIARSEAAAASLEEVLLRDLVGGISAGDDERAGRALAPDFAARLDDPRAAERVADPAASAGTPLLVRLRPGGPVLRGADLLERLAELAGGWSRHDRLGAQADRLELDADDPRRAFARAELRWAGEPDAAQPTRRDVRLTVALEARDVGGRWQLTRLALEEGTSLEAATPRFRDVARAVGLTWSESRRNRELGQAFVDRHRTFALGGLSVLDWNDDGHPDLVGVREGQFSLLFRNDGRGGFVPEPLPARGPGEHPAFLLVVDLDGDGRPELVGSKPTGYAGDRAFIGLWTRPVAGGPWVHRPRAIALPNPVGLRRLAVQTVVPFDLEGDGDLDLFLAVYGDATSRGEHYNTVDAADGGDNHLVVNQGGLAFTEESAARGIEGTRYTYVATAFDFDDDGDVDLFEGNDFGPNVLWLNDGAGQFQSDEALGFGGVPAYTMGATLADFDNSGRWSLYISNMSSEEGCRIVPLAADLSDAMRATVATIARGNMLYTQGDAPGDRWTESAVQRGVNEGEWAWGCAFVDVDNDGDRDLAVTNGFTSHSDPTLPDWQTYYWRQVVADGAALERGERSRDVNGRTPLGSFNGYERDRLFLNLGAGPMPDAGYVLGADDDHDGRAIAPIDFDGDGDLDLAVWALDGLVLLENQGPPAAWCRLALVDRRGSRTPLGAVATVRAGGVTRRDVVKLVDGFQTQVHPHLHFGLGAAERVDEVTVRWPGGAVDTWRDLPVGRLLQLVEGAPRAEARALPAWEQPALHLDLDARGQVLEPGGEALAGAPDGTPAVVRAQVPLDPGSTDLLTLVLDPRGALVRAFRGDPPAADVEAALGIAADEPAFPGLLVEHGRLALAEHRFREALALFREALDPGFGNEEDAPAWEGLGRAHVQLGRLDLAEEAYAAAVRADPDYGLGHFNLGVTRSHRGRPAEALAPLREALRIEGPRQRTLLALGEAAALAGDLPLALETFSRAAAADPADLDVRVNRARVLARLGRLPEAGSALREVLGRAPGHADARAVLARVLELQAR